MTAHKAQGKTMDTVIVDLESTSGTESPYVMLSRATSLAGVYILRPFNQKVIQRRPSQDVREEFRRLDILCHQTFMHHGTAEEASEAHQYLVRTFSAQASPNTEEPPEESADDARRLASLQRATSRLIAGAGNPQPDPRIATARPSTSSPLRRARIIRSSIIPVDNEPDSSTNKRPDGHRRGRTRSQAHASGAHRTGIIRRSVRLSSRKIPGIVSDFFGGPWMSWMTPARSHITQNIR
ncbi:hypothetical protein B0H19DRAFT_932942 [Mycena capillaripes]|nr:hypothetical protein B0H19DRAFT_932942 [Mycena capillaripes]